MSDNSDGEDPREFSGFYGKALEPYEEDSIPKKKPIAIEDQIAKDEHGRRRFHGAFTGGFSAGFFNTVGSLEGWRPTEFKSSRAEKARPNKLQRPEDFMDDEDMGEFGIAPQTIKATDEYDTSRNKRKRQQFSDGPIPGQPVLQTLIDSGNETVGYLLLRNMGNRHGDDDNGDENGENDDKDENIDGGKVYGCEMPKTYQIRKTLNNLTYNIDETYKKALINPKANTFGMGYSGLDRSHVNLFTSSKLVVSDRNNKKLSISGQAFGVGAFEEDDEDIYVREDITKYDFELTGEKTKEKVKDPRRLIFDLFVKSALDYPMIDKFLPPTIPASFTGKHKVKKSRFEPVHTQTSTTDEEVAKTKRKRHEMDAATRAMILGEDAIDIREPTPRISTVTPHTPQTSSQIKIETEDVDVRRSLFDVRPSGLIFDKFVSASKSAEHTEAFQPVAPSVSTHGTQAMREAATLKMFGVLTRRTESWMPNSLLCKRFNIPEPAFGDGELKTKQKRHRNLIFESASGLDLTNAPDVQNTHAAGLQTAASTQMQISPTKIPVIETISAPAAPSGSASNKANLASVSLAPTQAITAISSMASAKVAVEEKKALDPTEKLNISKNVDLFKAVFMDSDSDEEDNTPADNDKTVEIVDVDKRRRASDEGEEERIRHDEIKQKILAVDLLLPQIKPIKQGILSNVASIIFDAPPASAAVEEQSTQAVDVAASMKNSIAADNEDDNMYGPRLPTKITYRKPEKSTNLPLFNANVDDDDALSNSDTDWIERGVKEGKKEKTNKKHKHKKEKKHKKDKDKDKEKYKSCSKKHKRKID